MKQISEFAKPHFEIGTQYLSRGKHPRLCTIIDILTTTNSNGDVVSIRYVSTHKFMGQLITDDDVVGTTIEMGIQLLKEARGKL